MRVPEFRRQLHLAAIRLEYPLVEAYVREHIDEDFHDMMFRSLYLELPQHYVKQDVDRIKELLAMLPDDEPVPNFNEIVTYWTRRIWAKSHG